MFKALIAWLKGLVAKPTPPTPAPADRMTTIAPGVRTVSVLPAGGSVAFNFEPGDLTTFDPMKKRSICCARSSDGAFIEVRSYKVKRTPGTEPRYTWSWESKKTYRCELRNDSGRITWWIDGQQQAAVVTGSGSWEVCLGWPWDNAPKPGVSGRYEVVL